MKFAAAAATTLFASMASKASAFGVRPQHLARRAFSTSATRLNANVLKLSDPSSQLLDQVDVFIFDCDGVIWRVRPRMKGEDIEFVRDDIGTQAHLYNLICFFLHSAIWTPLSYCGIGLRSFWLHFLNNCFASTFMLG